MAGRTFIDTNVFVYGADSSEPEKRQRALEILADTPGITISTQVLNEFYHVATPVPRRRQLGKRFPVSERAKIPRMADPVQPTTDDVIETIGKGRLVPVIVVDDPHAASPLGEALVAGGLRCAEVTFRTSAAEAALAAMAADTRLLVGAGTVVRPEQVDRAVAAGARYIVSPGFSPAVVRHCQRIGVPVVPGVATASDIQAAGEAGLEVLKFFPAGPLGGLAMLKALAAPFPSVRFIPTGGVSAGNLSDYLAHPSVLAVGGSWMVAPKLIAAGAWDEITRLTTEAVSMAARP